MRRSGLPLNTPGPGNSLVPRVASEGVQITAETVVWGAGGSPGLCPHLTQPCVGHPVHPAPLAGVWATALPPPFLVTCEQAPHQLSREAWGQAEGFQRTAAPGVERDPGKTCLPPAMKEPQLTRPCVSPGSLTRAVPQPHIPQLSPGGQS